MIIIKTNAILVLMWLVSACSAPDPKSQAKDAVDAITGPDTKTDDPAKKSEDSKTIIEEKFVLRKLLGPDENKRLDFSGNSKLYLENDQNLVHLSATGKSTIFNSADQTWGVTSLIDNNVEGMYRGNLISDGWIAFSATELSYLDKTAQALESFELPLTFTDASQLGALALGIGSLFIEDKNYFIEYGANDAKFYPLPTLSSKVKSLGLCASECKYWIWDGASFYAAKSATSEFKKITIEMDIPADISFLQFVGKLYFKDSKYEFETLFALADDGSLFKGGVVKSEVLEANWKNVLAISQQSCIPCHSEDGFDKESTWTALKDDIIKRVDVKTKKEVFAMPTWETKYGKEFSDNSRTLIASWLNGEEATSGGTFGNGGSNELTPITGEFKDMVEDYCLGCHTAGNNEEFWIGNRAQSKSRIESGNMPQNRDMLPAQRNRFIQLLEAL